MWHSRVTTSSNSHLYRQTSGRAQANEPYRINDYVGVGACVAEAALASYRPKTNSDTLDHPPFGGTGSNTSCKNITCQAHSNKASFAACRGRLYGLNPSNKLTLLESSCSLREDGGILMLRSSEVPSKRGLNWLARGCTPIMTEADSTRPFFSSAR